MIAVDIGLFDATSRIPYPVWRGSALFGTGSHGDEATQLFAPMTRYQALVVYDRLAGDLIVRATAAGYQLWEGRVEDIQITDDGIAVSALGRWRAFRDAPLTAMYSTTDLRQWRIMTEDDRNALRTPERFLFRLDQTALVIALKQGMQYSNQTIGAILYQMPDRAINQLQGMQLRISYNLPATYICNIVRYTGGPGGVGVVLETFAGTGAAVTVGRHYTWYGNAADTLEIDVSYNSGVPVTYAGQDGDNYVKVDLIRISGVDDALSRVTGTLGTAVAAPGVAVVTPSDGTSRIYVGQVITIGGATVELVTVTAVTSTTFTATFANAHLATDTIRAFVCYADTVATRCRDAVNAASAGALSTSNALIQSPGLDLLEAVYEDADMGDILTTLAGYGDTGGNRWDVGVSGDQVYLRPQGAQAQAWYVDVADLQVQQTLENLINSTYGVYRNAAGRTLRTAPVADAVSVSRYGLTRRAAIPAQTTSATQATNVAATARADQADPPPRATMRIRRIYSASGQEVPGFLVRAGDTLTIRNLPPVAGAAIDKIRTFRLTETDYDAATGVLSVVPETPPAELEFQLARLPIVGSLAT